MARSLANRSASVRACIEARLRLHPGESVTAALKWWDELAGSLRKIAGEREVAEHLLEVVRAASDTH